ncbi:MAG: DUF3570 domain-containing protein [Nitrospirae bacterium]|nr:DUF3570 domain-containing protein [Nitrospirota bacterium]
MGAIRLMQLKKFFSAILILCLLLFPFSHIYSEDSVTFKYFYFKDNGDVRVDSPMVILKKDISFNTNVSLKFNLDAITGATKGSAVGSNSNVDATTGATLAEHRYEYGAAISHKIEWANPTNLGLGYNFSNESDYTSHTMNLSLAQDLFQRNTTIAGSYTRNWDRISPNAWDWDGNKYVDTFSISIAQVITKKTVALIGYEYSQIRGYQANPYKTVDIAGIRYYEVFPESRKRHAVISRINQYLPYRSSIQIDYRYYLDSWDINAYTVDTKLFHYLTDNLILRLRYRYYNQDSAYFYKENYTTLQEYIAADYKLSAFSANLFGIKLDYGLKGIDWFRKNRILRESRVDINYERYMQTTGFYANIIQIGYYMPF